jgi:hypothetical protein
MGAEGKACCGAAERVARGHSDIAKLEGYRLVQRMAEDLVFVPSRRCKFIRRLRSGPCERVTLRCSQGHVHSNWVDYYLVARLPSKRTLKLSDMVDHVRDGLLHARLSR